MEVAPRTDLEPLNEAGPEMPVAPTGSHRAALKPAAIGAAKAAEAAAKLAGSPQPVASSPACAPGTMDKDFIARNQIVERYLCGKLPIKGATDFERFCSEHPELLDELGLPERVNAGLRLLEASGKPEPWQETPKRPWEKPQVALGLAAAVVILSIALAGVASSISSKTHTIEKLRKQASEQPLEPATSTRTIRLLPSRTGESTTPAVVVGGGGTTQLADLKIDLSRSAFRVFRVTVDRVDQGRVMVLNNLLKDSNGHVRIALNSSALGPGNYQFTIEGVTWRGETVPDAWITIGVAR